MATYNKFEDFVEQLLTAKHNFTSAGDVFKIYLSNTAPSASADAVKADLAEISAGNGYTAGGSSAANVGSRSSGTVSVNTSQVSWTSSGAGFTARYCILYNDTHASDALVGYLDLGSAQTADNGAPFTINAASPLFTLAG